MGSVGPSAPLPLEQASATVTANMFVDSDEEMWSFQETSHLHLPDPFLGAGQSEPLLKHPTTKHYYT